MPWKPWLGAVPDAAGTHFRVWAPRAPALSVAVGERATAMRRDADGYFTAHLPGVRAGERYWYAFADGRRRPDPASLSQPEGVHGPSEVVDLDAVGPRSARARTPLEQLVFCEIHLGTYSQRGDAEGAAELMPELAADGFNAVEVMPVAAFPGERNWGYDGVAPFSAHAAYGGPAALARLVDAARGQGLSTFLDVVYNHLGPEGNYLAEFAPYFTAKHKTPWGDALDFSLEPVRRYFVECSRRWAAWFDGLRLDAVHGIVDGSPRHILREIAEAVHADGGLVIAESDLNDPKLIDVDGLDSVWADDLHHCLHVALTGETGGYYQDYPSPVKQLVTAINEGWVYQGQLKPSFGRPHGKPAAHLPPRRFVVFAQNHDQIGNRARGERLAALTDEGGLRAAAALVALQPALPLYFQGEPWAAREPFLYFVSHGDAALVEAVRNGRREEFKSFGWQGEVPDPQSPETFLRCKLDRSRKNAAAQQWHRALMQLRRTLHGEPHQAWHEGPLLLLRRGRVLLVAAFGEGEAKLPAGGWRVLLDSGAASVQAGAVRMRGRGAVVLEQA